MKERPILFNAEMVCAVLDGRKTQTRRVVNTRRRPAYDIIQDTDIVDGKEISLGFEDEFGEWHKTESVCPFGNKGDRLWVRETFCATWDGDSSMITDFRADGMAFCPSYKSGEKGRFVKTWAPPEKWTPSIFMNRCYSRINLEIVDIRVERVADISDDDARAEGIHARFDPGSPSSIMDNDKTYSILWDSINAKRKDKNGKLLNYSWADNPWVWVVEFKKI